MANREVRLITKNSSIVDRPLPSSLLAGEAIVNTAQGIVFFSGVTQSTNNWVPSSDANFFEVGSNLYNLKIRNKIVSYGEMNDLSGKFLSGTTSGFSLANISDIKGFDTFLTGGTYYSGTTTFKNNTGGTFTISGYSTGYTLTDTKIVDALGYTPLSAYTDTFLTGFTYQNTTNTLEITLNDGSIFNTSINEMSGMTFNGSVSATTYYGDGSNLTGINATEVTGFTFNTSNYELGLGQNNNNNFTVDLSILSSDMTITGGTFDSNTGTATFTNNSGGTFDVTGFLTGFTDIYTTGATYDDLTGVATFTRNDGNNYTLSGLYTGSTYIIPNLQEVTDSGNTTTNDIIVDAGGNYVSYITQSSIGSSYLLTYSAQLSGNGSLSLVSIGGGGTGVLTSTLVPSPNVVQLEFPNKQTGSYTIATIDDIPTDKFVTGFTNNNNVFTISDNAGQDYSTKLDILTGLTINGALSVTGNTSSDLVKITQLGTGNAFVVKDSNNPDNTPFVIDNNGFVGIGFENPSVFNSRLLSVGTSNGESGVNGIGFGNHGVLGKSELGYAGLYGLNSADGAGVGIGVYGRAQTASESYIGQIWIGGKFEAVGDGELNYSVQLLDGTEGINKVLVSKSLDGKANWSSVLSGLTYVYSNSISTTTISATTYQNLPLDVFVTGGTYNFTGDTLTLNRNDGNNIQITGFTYERQSNYVYPYHYSGTAPLGSLISSNNWIIKRVDFTTPGSPITLSAIGAWDNRYTLTYS